MHPGLRSRLRTIGRALLVLASLLVGLTIGAFATPGETKYARALARSFVLPPGANAEFVIEAQYDNAETGTLDIIVYCAAAESWRPAPGQQEPVVQGRLWPYPSGPGAKGSAPRAAAVGKHEQCELGKTCTVRLNGGCSVPEWRDSAPVEVPLELRVEAVARDVERGALRVSLLTPVAFRTAP